jgi:hypothetical protein
MKFAFWTKLREQFDQSASGGEEIKEGSANPLADILEPLEAARKAALNVDEDALKDAVRAERLKEAMEEEQRQIRLHRQQMLDDIVDLHKKLGTGMGPEQLEQLAADLKASLDQFAHRRSDSLADRGLRAILASIHDDALQKGWELLESKLADAKLAWPAPPGISPSATPDEIAHKTKLHTAILHRDFLTYDLKLMAALIEGAVPAWRAVYPERNSSVWTSTCYQAVGGAYAARRHRELLELAEQRIDEIRRRVAERLEPVLAPVQAELKKGVSSLNQALRLSEEANRAGEKIASEVFWEVLQPHHSKA